MIMAMMHAQPIDAESKARRSTPDQAVIEGDTGEHLLSPASVLPEQFYVRTAGSSHPVSGVRALMWAMLEDAIVCVQQQALTPSRRRQRLAREAEQWICTDNTAWVFSFLNVCAALGLEPEYLRTKLTQWRQRWTRSASPKGVMGEPSVVAFKIAA
jgi:hypothetical protein